MKWVKWYSCQEGFAVLFFTLAVALDLFSSNVFVSLVWQHSDFMQCTILKDINCR
jgi:hypothetical protein